MAERVGRGVEKSGKELLSAVIRESEAKEIGVAGVGVFFVTGRIGGSESGQHIPRGISSEKLFGGEIVAGKLSDGALRAAATFEKDS